MLKIVYEHLIRNVISILKMFILKLLISYKEKTVNFTVEKLEISIYITNNGLRSLMHQEESNVSSGLFLPKCVIQN